MPDLAGWKAAMGWASGGERSAGETGGGEGDGGESGVETQVAKQVRSGQQKARRTAAHKDRVCTAATTTGTPRNDHGSLHSIFGHVPVQRNELALFYKLPADGTPTV
jgi:hypothetical protein